MPGIQPAWPAPAHPGQGSIMPHQTHITHPALLAAARSIPPVPPPHAPEYRHDAWEYQPPPPGAIDGAHPPYDYQRYREDAVWPEYYGHQVMSCISALTPYLIQFSIRHRTHHHQNTCNLRQTALLLLTLSRVPTEHHRQPRSLVDVNVFALQQWPPFLPQLSYLTGATHLHGVRRRPSVS
jgi:hypothetical protein